MAFVVPQFPLNINVWRAGNATSNPPDVTTTGNLSPGKRVTTASNIGEVPPPAMLSELLFPKQVDIRGANQGAGSDTLEIPAASGRYYSCLQTEEVGLGFANHHRIAFVQQAPTSFSPILLA